MRRSCRHGLDHGVGGVKRRENRSGYRCFGRGRKNDGSCPKLLPVSETKSTGAGL